MRVFHEVPHLYKRGLLSGSDCEINFTAFKSTGQMWRRIFQLNAYNPI